MIVSVMCLVLFSLCFILPTHTYAFAEQSDADYSSLKFTLYTNSENGKSEYKVMALDRTITEIEIPKEYNNIPVTEVSDNAFTNCSSLEYVKIPNTIIRIGNNAFSNCTNLRTVIGMTNVKILGNNVFNNCTSIQDLILPANLQYVGSSIIKNVQNDVYSRRSEAEMSLMNENWDIGRSESSRLIFGNKLVCDDVVIDGELVGYEVRECQNLAQDEDFIVYSSWKRNDDEEYLPILNIKRYAFDCNVFGSLTIKHDESLNFNHTININSAAFSNVTADSINIEVDITLIDDSEQDPAYLEGESGTSVSIFEWTQVHTITLPVSLDRITRSMFSWSSVSEIRSTDTSIESNHLSSNVNRIDTSAFEGTMYLEKLFLPSTIETLGESVFNAWGDGGIYEKQTIKFDMEAAPTDWNKNWSAGINYDNVEIIFEVERDTFKINFDKQNGEGGTNYVEAEYGQPMPLADAPQRNNYVFQGYYSDQNGTGVKYYDSNMNSIRDWDIKTNTTLYAYWTGIESFITFDKSGGTGGTNSILAEYDKDMPKAVAPQRDNYIFQGYFTEPNGNGVQYYNSDMTSVTSWDKVNNTTLYAYWKGVPYSIILDNQGGSGGTTNIIVEYGQPMPLAIAPARQYYIFQGYYTGLNGGDIKFYDAQMNSVRNWDQISSMTLYAHWTGINSTILFDAQGGEGVSEYVTAEYGKYLPNAKAPRMVGYEFKGFYLLENNNEIYYYNENMDSIKQWDQPEPTVILLAKWTKKKCIITLKDGVTVTAIYGEPMPAAPKPTGSEVFQGYYSSDNVKYYDSNMNSVRNWDREEDTTLYDKWSKRTYYITFDQSGINALSGHAGDYVDLPNISKPGYDGVWTYNGEEVDMHYQITRSCTLVAKFIPIKYYCIKYIAKSDKSDMEVGLEFYSTYDSPYWISANPIDGYTFEVWDFYVINNGEVLRSVINYSEQATPMINTNLCTVNGVVYRDAVVQFVAHYKKNSCLADGSLITLADGTQKAVETLTGNEELLVWNMFTGTFDIAPILFIDKDSTSEYEVINLYFSDGTNVKVIYEHGFWDYDLNQYVFLRKDASKYIGHWFNKQTTDENGDIVSTRVQLVDVAVQMEHTSAWSPVTYGHLCYYVNGMLSMPGATTGLINIFDVDPETMKIDEAKYQADIEEYGLFTYEEFASICPIPEDAFEAFNGKYLKVAIGKGLTSIEELESLIARYSQFWE